MKKRMTFTKVLTTVTVAMALTPGAAELASTDYAKPYQGSWLLSQPTAEVIQEGEIHLGGTGTLNQTQGSNVKGDFTFGLGGVAEISTSLKTVADNLGEGQQSLPVAALKIQVYRGKEGLPLKGALMINRAFESRQSISRPDSGGLAEKVDYGVGQVEAFALTSYQWRALTFNLGGKFTGTEITRDKGEKDTTLYEGVRLFPLAGFKYDVNRNTQILGEVEGEPYFAYGDNADDLVKARQQWLGQLGVRYYILTWMSIDACAGMQFVEGSKSDRKNFLNDTTLRTRLSATIPTKTVFRRIVGQLN